MNAITRNTPAASSGIIEFALSMANLIYRLVEMERLFRSEELAKELEGKREAEIRAILKERFKHLL